jgi:hypothetical protein
MPDDRRGWSVDLQALVLTLPFVPRDTARARALLISLPRYVPLPNDENLYNYTGIYTPRRLLLQGLLAVQLGDSVQALQIATRLKSAFTGRENEYGQQGDRLIHAMIAYGRRDWNDVLEQLGPPRIVPIGVYPSLLTVGAALDRFLRAYALEKLRRFEEAERWYATFPDNTGYDLHYLRVVSYRRAVVLDSLRRTADAQRFYARADLLGKL